MTKHFLLALCIAVTGCVVGADSTGEGELVGEGAVGDELVDESADSESVDTEIIAAVGTEYKDAVGVGTIACYTLRFDTSWGYGAYCQDPRGDTSEHFYVWDFEGDGMRTGLLWEVLSGGSVVRRGICSNSHGANSSARCRFAIGEGKLIRMRLGRCDAGGARTCRSFSHWQNLTGWKQSRG